MSNQWFRMYSEFANDPKVQMLSEIYQRRLVMMFCLRCNGHETLQDKHVAFQLRVIETEWQETKAEFIARGFIDNDNKLLNWDKRQFRSDSSTERVRKHRNGAKQPHETICNVSVTPQIQNRTDTEQKAQPRAEETFFQKCREYILEKFPLPGLGISDSSPIHLWQANGYDFERHIKPVVDSKAARGAKPGSFSYFTPAIENAAQQKITAAPKPDKPKELTPDEIENQKKWYKKTGIQHKIYNPEGIQASA